MDNKIETRGRGLWATVRIQGEYVFIYIRPPSSVGRASDFYG